tara:strand:+ start:244 stop:738 length:495 start_codon:yes stop_codon:yes gene_type:complete
MKQKKLVKQEKLVKPEKTLFIRLNSRKFPEDLLNIVSSYIPINIRYVLNKFEFNKHYIKSLGHIERSKSFDSNIKRIIRQDNILCFSILLSANYDFWIKIKNFKSKIGIHRCRTNNYISYLKELCIYFKASHSKVELIEYIEKKRTNKNKELKNIKIKYTRWNN